MDDRIKRRASQMHGKKKQRKMLLLFQTLTKEKGGVGRKK